MIFGRRYKLASGRPPFNVSSINFAIKEIERLSRSYAGIGTHALASGPLFSGLDVQIRMGITGSDGIPAKVGNVLGMSQDISDAAITQTAVYPNPPSFELMPLPSTFTGLNLSSQPVAGSTDTLFLLLWGAWVCIWEDCPASS